MSTIFNGDWWSVRLPSAWHAVAEEHGASFFRTPTAGTLQLSAARKSGTEVSDDDLKELAAERLAAGHQLQEAQHDAFSGFQCIRSDKSLYWNEWWLKHGSLLIYATYVVRRDKVSAAEKREVLKILKSLAVRSRSARVPHPFALLRKGG